MVRSGAGTPPRGRAGGLLAPLTPLPPLPQVRGEGAGRCPRHGQQEDAPDGAAAPAGHSLQPGRLQGPGLSPRAAAAACPRRRLSVCLSVSRSPPVSVLNYRPWKLKRPAPPLLVRPPRRGERGCDPSPWVWGGFGGLRPRGATPGLGVGFWLWGARCNSGFLPVPVPPSSSQCRLPGELGGGQGDPQGPPRGRGCPPKETPSSWGRPHSCLSLIHI